MYLVEGLEIDGPGVADRIVELQRAAYAVEAALIGFSEIPLLREGVSQVRLLDLHWVGAFEDETLVGGLAYADAGPVRDIDRLFVDPAHARRGIGRRLVRSVLDAPTVTVSTGSDNTPAVGLYVSLGFRERGRREIGPGVTITIFERSSVG